MTMGADRVRRMTVVEESEAGPAVFSGSDGTAPQGVELRHLRYFVAVADAGTFTHAAEKMFIAQPTLSQQIRRLEEIVGTPLLQRRREGVRLTEAGSVLLEESRTVLSLTLAFAATASRPTAVLTGPQQRAGTWCPPVQPDPATSAYEMVPARVEHCPLTATAALVWSVDLPRQLQQVLFDTADSITF